MDISFKTENGRFNYRVCAIIINDNKLLAIRDERPPHFYVPPGGRVKLYETAEEAILREIEEELKVKAKIIRPLWVNQNFFCDDVTGVHTHELGFYFLVNISHTDIMNMGDRFTLTEGNRKHDFEWLPFERLKDEQLYPVFIKEKIFDLPETVTLLTNKNQTQKCEENIK